MRWEGDNGREICKNVEEGCRGLFYKFNKRSEVLTSYFSNVSLSATVIKIG
jgi:hypothetical protein